MYRSKVLSATMAALGALICLILSGSKLVSFCVTSGCGIYSSYKFAGLSFYAWGAIFFATVLVLNLAFRCNKLTASVVALAVLGDAGFLAYQTFFWPCTNCLLVAVVIAILAIVHISDKTAPRWARRALVVSMVLWVPFFCAAGSNAVKEWAVTPYVLNQLQEEPLATVYFSPTCPSCEETVREMVSSPDVSSIAFVPIAKSEKDKRMLAALPENVSVTEIVTIFEEGATSVEPKLIDRIRLWRNQSSLASLGFSSVPVVVGNIVPRRQVTQSFFPGFPGTVLSVQHSSSPTPAHKKDGSCQVFQADPECGTK